MLCLCEINFPRDPVGEVSFCCQSVFSGRKWIICTCITTKWQDTIYCICVLVSVHGSAGQRIMDFPVSLLRALALCYSALQPPLAVFFFFFFFCMGTGWNDTRLVAFKHNKVRFLFVHFSCTSLSDIRDVLSAQRILNMISYSSWEGAKLFEERKRGKGSIVFLTGSKSEMFFFFLSDGTLSWN